MNSGGNQTGEWMIAGQAFPELEHQARVRVAGELGHLALQGSVSTEVLHEVNESTLLAAIQLAALGNEQALKTVQTNVSTDIAERLFKAGHQTHVPLQFTSGELWQNGRKLKDINKNTFEHMPLNGVMQKRAKAEMKNTFLFEQLISEGVLNDYDAVVLSPTPTDATTRRDYNFFTATDSLSIQYLSGSGENFVMETAMVAGKVSPDVARKDLWAINQLIQKHGVVASHQNENELISHVMLVPKTEHGGVHTIVQEYDDVLGGTFYGEQKPQQDYWAYREVCEARTKSFDSLVADITRQLLAEASAFTSPYEAIERLDYLSERMSVKRAATDTSINAAVFGTTAAFHIEQARRFMEQGEIEQANFSMQAAQRTANSSSCPLFKGANNEAAQNSNNDKEKTSDQEDKYGPLRFQCKNGHWNVRPRNTLITQCRVKSCKDSVGC